MTWFKCQFHFSFREVKNIEKYFMKFHLPKIQFQPLSGRFMDLLP